jgi:hypothetical protein
MFLHAFFKFVKSLLDFLHLTRHYISPPRISITVLNSQIVFLPPYFSVVPDGRALKCGSFEVLSNRFLIFSVDFSACELLSEELTEHHRVEPCSLVILFSIHIFSIHNLRFSHCKWKYHTLSLKTARACVAWPISVRIQQDISSLHAQEDIRGLRGMIIAVYMLSIDYPSCKRACVNHFLQSHFRQYKRKSLGLF